MANTTTPSNSAIIDRLFDLVEKLIDCRTNEARIAALEAKIAEMEAEWPKIKEIE